MSFSNNDYGSIRRVSDFSFVWHIPQLINIIVGWNDYAILSPYFTFREYRWHIILRKSETKSGAMSRLCLTCNCDSADTQIYRLRVTDNYGLFPVIKDTFYRYSGGTLQDHLESDLLEDASRRAPGGDLSVHLDFYREGDLLPGVVIIPAKSRPSTADCGTQTSPSRVHQERTVSSDSDASLPADSKRRGTQTSPVRVNDQGASSCSAQTDNLGQNLKDLLLCGRKSDITLVVQGKEFKAHQNILVARSPVFGATLNEDWLEQASGAVQITDCDAEVFQDFLLYLYSGKVETLAVRNVVELFTIADKYDVKSLVTACVDFMFRNLTVDTFCDFVSLALRHCEQKLMDSADRFFADNVKQIIPTEKWKVFNAQNPKAANELLVKALCQ